MIDQIKTDTLVIGGGFAGIEASLRLKSNALDHVLIEQHDKPLHSWREQRWDNFRMNTPHWANRLHGQIDTVADEKVGLPIVETLALWDNHINESNLPLRLDTCVTQVSKIDESDKESERGSERFRVTCVDSNEKVTEYLTKILLHARAHYSHLKWLISRITFLKRSVRSI